MSDAVLHEVLGRKRARKGAVARGGNEAGSGCGISGDANGWQPVHKKGLFTLTQVAQEEQDEVEEAALAALPQDLSMLGGTRGVAAALALSAESQAWAQLRTPLRKQEPPKPGVTVHMELDNAGNPFDTIWEDVEPPTLDVNVAADGERDDDDGDREGGGEGEGEGDADTGDADFRVLGLTAPAAPAPPATPALPLPRRRTAPLPSATPWDAAAVTTAVTASTARVHGAATGALADTLMTLGLQDPHATSRLPGAGVLSTRREREKAALVETEADRAGALMRRSNVLFGVRGGGVGPESDWPASVLLDLAHALWDHWCSDSNPFEPVECTPTDLALQRFGFVRTPGSATRAPVVALAMEPVTDAAAVHALRRQGPSLSQLERAFLCDARRAAALQALCCMRGMMDSLGDEARQAAAATASVLTSGDTGSDDAATLGLRSIRTGGSGSGASLHDVFRDLACAIARAKDALAHTRLFAVAINPELEDEASSLADLGITAYVPIARTPEHNGRPDTFIEVYKYVERALRDRNLRKLGDNVFQQIFSPAATVGANGSRRAGGWPTHAWRDMGPLDVFIKKHIVTQAAAPSIWAKAQHNLGAVIANLKSWNEENFPELEPDHHWFAYEDGLYNTVDMRFLRYGHPGIPRGVVACNYLMFPFGLTPEQVRPSAPGQLGAIDHYFQVMTPTFDRLINFQLDPDRSGGRVRNALEAEMIKAWLLAFMGKALFRVREFDDWEMWLHVYGPGRSGKSTVLNIIKAWLAKRDVGVLANNSQANFGWETLYDKRVIFCYEVTKAFSQCRTQLQSAVTGEGVSLQRKFKTEITVDWTAQFVTAGNEVFGFGDAQGAIRRRILFLHFPHTVDESVVDTDMRRKLELELGPLMHKCCMAYHQAVHSYGKTSLWGTRPQYDDDGKVKLGADNLPLEERILPNYFFKGRDHMESMMLPLVGFLNNESTLVFHKNAAMPLKRFQELARKFWEDNNQQAVSLLDDNATFVLNKHMLRVVVINDETRDEHSDVCGGYRYLGQPVPDNQRWVLGVTESDAAAHLKAEARDLAAAVPAYSLGLMSALAPTPAQLVALRGSTSGVAGAAASAPRLTAMGADEAQARITRLVEEGGAHMADVNGAWLRPEHVAATQAAAAHAADARALREMRTCYERDAHML